MAKISVKLNQERLAYIREGLQNGKTITSLYNETRGSRIGLRKQDFLALARDVRDKQEINGFITSGAAKAKIEQRQRIRQAIQAKAEKLTPDKTKQRNFIERALRKKTAPQIAKQTIVYPSRRAWHNQIYKSYPLGSTYAGDPFIRTGSRNAVAEFVKYSRLGNREIRLIEAGRETGSSHVRALFANQDIDRHFQLGMIGHYYNPDSAEWRYNVESGSKAHNPLDPNAWGQYVGECIASAILELGGSGWILEKIVKLWVIETVWADIKSAIGLY